MRRPLAERVRPSGGQLRPDGWATLGIHLTLPIRTRAKRSPLPPSGLLPSPGGERLALRLAGTAFALVATYLAVEATRSLMHSRHVEATAFGLSEAVASLIVLPRLASGKYSLSRRLGSPALRADSLQSWSGAAL